MHKILMVFLLIFILSACRDDTLDEKTYADFEHLSAWDDSRHDDIWLIYFYHPSCGACDEIKMDIFYFATHGSVPLYFLNAGNAVGRSPDQAIQYVPTLVVMQGSQYIEFVVGVTDVRELLSAFDANRYELP